MSLAKEKEDLEMVRLTDEEGHLQSAEAAAALCNGLMETTAELISVLERETAPLRKRQNTELPALQLKKQTLSAALAKNLGVLRTNAEYIKMAVPEQVRDLKEQQKQFHKSLEANHDALLAMKAVSEQLIQVIAKKVDTQAGGPQTYGKEGSVSASRPHQPAAISYDTAV